MRGGGSEGGCFFSSFYKSVSGIGVRSMHALAPATVWLRRLPKGLIQKMLAWLGTHSTKDFNRFTTKISTGFVLRRVSSGFNAKELNTFDTIDLNRFCTTEGLITF